MNEIITLLATPATGPLLAALLSAFVALNQQKLAKLIERNKEFATDRQRMRDDLRQLAGSVERAMGSVARTRSRPPVSGGESFLMDIAGSFAVVADLFSKTCQQVRIGYPLDVIEEVEALRRQLVEFYLTLDMNPQRDAAKQARLDEQYRQLEERSASLASRIRVHVQP